MTSTVSPGLRDLLKSNILLCNERQLFLSDKLGLLGSSAWNVDFTTGTLAFGADEFVLKNIQIIASYSNVSQTWSWSWCHQSFATFSEEVLEDAFKAKKFGERYNIPEFMCEEKIPLDRSTAMALAMVVVDIVGADAFYPADINNGNGIAFITVRDERLSLPGPNEWSKFIKHFPRLLTSTLDSFPQFISNQFQMVEDYCANRGEETWIIDSYTPAPHEAVVEETYENGDNDIYTIRVVSSVKDKRGDVIVKFVFDTLDRIRNIQIKLHPAHEEGFVSTICSAREYPGR